MEDLTLAFASPLARAAATASDQPLDRISVRDYVREIEIGAFYSERGRRQRLRFNVVLEVAHHSAAQDDDVDKVVSYDQITGAINDQLATGRINLLETLAERVAQACLQDRRAVRCFVRIEKLDRIPGALGVEIMRSRLPADAPRVGVGAVATAPAPVIVYLGAATLAGPELIRWLDQIEAANVPALIVVPPMPIAVPPSEVAARRISLLAMEQNAWMLAGRDPRVHVVGSQTEIDWALSHQQLCVWAPGKLVNDAARKLTVGPDQPVELAAWLAGHLGARQLVLIGASAPAAEPGRDLDVLSLAADASYDFAVI